MRLLFLSLFILLSYVSFSQDHSIKVLARYKNKVVTLRWAPSDPYVWQLGNKYGFIVERFSLLNKGKLDEEASRRAKPLSSEPIKPYSKEAFEQVILKDERAGVVQECIYGESFELSGEGSPAAILKKKQDMENRFGMALFVCDMSQTVAIASGLLWHDRSPLKGSRHAYRIRLAETPKGITVEPGVVVVDITEEKPLPAVNNLKVKFEDQKATLTWPVFTHKGIYTAYNIERSVDGKHFKPLSDLPYTMTREGNKEDNSVFVDSLENNEQTYYYRVKGISPFAEEGPASNLVSGKGRTGLEGVVAIQSATVIENKKVTLTWKAYKEYEASIKGFYVMRSSKPDGPYTILNKNIVPVSQNTFSDNPTANNNYYQIKYIHKTTGEVYFSFPYLAQLVDSIPPIAPFEIKGMVDSIGVVNISWKANTESDLLGYRVFRANSMKEEFIETTRKILEFPSFVDTVTIHTLTKDVFYKVVAVDKNYNPSPYSAPITLKRPDKIAPSAPVFTKTEVAGNSVTLEWINSSSNDVAKYELLRKEIGKDSVKIANWKDTENRTSFKDSTAGLGSRYKYFLIALDSSMNKGIAASKEVLFETGVRKAVTEIKASPDRVNRKVILEWKYYEPGVSKYTIYRAKEGEPMTLYKVISGNEGKFIDSDVEINSVYNYKIKAGFKGGVQSEMSGEVKVKY